MISSFSSETRAQVVKEPLSMLIMSWLEISSSFLTSSPCTFVEPAMPNLHDPLPPKGRAGEAEGKGGQAGEAGLADGGGDGLDAGEEAGHEVRELPLRLRVVLLGLQDPPQSMGHLAGRFAIREVEGNRLMVMASVLMPYDSWLDMVDKAGRTATLGPANYPLHHR